jgi:hypothetical protein
MTALAHTVRRETRSLLELNAEKAIEEIREYPHQRPLLVQLVPIVIHPDSSRRA